MLPHVQRLDGAVQHVGQRDITDGRPRHDSRYHDADALRSEMRGLLAQTPLDGGRCFLGFANYSLPTSTRFLEGEVVPFGCKVTSPAENRYVADSQPDGYLIVLDDSRRPSYREPVRDTLRHELAHAVDFHETGHTTEETDNHAEWMRRFGLEPRD